jgi:Fe2+ or Zn2+ uptake regulation protein
MLDTDDTRLTQALRDRGQRVTPQRIAIARALRRLDRHASAEDVAAEVAPQLPGVSVPTVYATLDLLADMGFARRLTVTPGAVLYDPHVEDHHHAVCSRCGRVEDLSAPIDALEALRSAVARGFVPDRAEVVVSGLCRDCAARPGEPVRHGA